VAIRAASTAAIAPTAGPPVSPMVGASAAAASATKIVVRDDLAIAACGAGAIATLRGSAGVA
jgi:hypothetical protein